MNWANLKAGQVSGLYERVKELHKVGLQLGYDTGICSADVAKKDGYKLVGAKGKVTFEVKPWSYSEGDDVVNVIHSHVPDSPKFEQLKHKVILLHGSPEYCVYSEIIENRWAWSIAVDAIRECELAISWTKRHADFWRQFASDPNKVKYVHAGIDIKRWTPELPQTIKLLHHPAIVYIDMWRPMIKTPLTLLTAIKKVHKEFPTARLHLFNCDSVHQLFWQKFISKLNVASRLVENFKINPLAHPWHIYRAADIIVSPTTYGDISSVALEAMACGTPVVILEGDEHASMKCKDTADSMAEAIIHLWMKMQKDEKKVRKKARKIITKNYNVADTVKGMAVLYERLLEK